MTACASGLSGHPLPTQATGEVVGDVLERLGPGPDVAFLFGSAHHTGAFDDVARAVRELLGPRVLVGCTSSTVVGGREEVEEGPALSLLAVRFDAGATPARGLRLHAVAGPDGPQPVGLPAPAETAAGGALVLLADPYSFPVPELLDELARTAPGLPVLGGLAGAARAPGGNRLVLDGAVHQDGAVAVLLPPGVATTPLVSQGCRPIGDPMVVTRASGNLLVELASEPALPRLRRLVETMTDAERRLAAKGLHIGRVVDERRDTYERGDFLVRTVLGAVPDQDAVAVGEAIDVGTTVQFQVRDAAAADEDLRALLGDASASGALLFTCNGRGSHLFGRPDHDAALVDAATPGRATAGMSCAGEIGPVGGRSFLHGYTASALLFD